MDQDSGVVRESTCEASLRNDWTQEPVRDLPIPPGELDIEMRNEGAPVNRSRLHFEQEGLILRPGGRP